jgi:hypothetical protein
MRHLLGEEATMQTKAGHLWLPIAVLVLFALAGCGAAASPASSGLTPTAVHIQRRPTAVHIQRRILRWDTNNGEFPAPPAIDVTSTSSARVAAFFDHVRSLPAYSQATPIMCTGNAHGEVVTLITFLQGGTALLQVRIDQGCGLTSIVGKPNTFLQTDDQFFSDLYFLVAYPT